MKCFIPTRKIVSLMKQVGISRSVPLYTQAQGPPGFQEQAGRGWQTHTDCIGMELEYGLRFVEDLIVTKLNEKNWSRAVNGLDRVQAGGRCTVGLIYFRGHRFWKCLRVINVEAHAAQFRMTSILISLEIAFMPLRESAQTPCMYVYNLS